MINNIIKPSFSPKTYRQSESNPHKFIIDEEVDSGHSLTFSFEPCAGENFYLMIHAENLSSDESNLIGNFIATPKVPLIGYTYEVSSNIVALTLEGDEKKGFLPINIFAVDDASMAENITFTFSCDNADGIRLNVELMRVFQV